MWYGMKNNHWPEVEFSVNQIRFTT